MNKKYPIAALAVGAMLAAAPAHAESDKSHGEGFGLKLGGIARILSDEKREHKRGDTAKADGAVSVHGTVSAISGSILTLSGKNGATYTVQAANAEVTNGVLADIDVGDTVKVKGTLSGSIIVATRVDDTHINKRDMQARLENLRAGIVTSVSGGVFTLTRFGTGTSATVTTNASTTVKLNGQATTTAAITPGTAVVVVGSSGTTSPDTVVGSVIHVITKGFGWLKHFLAR